MAAPRIPLTRDRIVEAAVAVADRGGPDGLGAVSMRNVGKELGVEAMSLYHHVANKEALLDALADWVFSGIDLPGHDEPWRAALRRRSVSARARLAAHPWGIGLVESRRTPGAALLRHHDAVLGTLRRGGFSLAAAAHAFSVVDAYIYGFVITEANLPFQAPEEVEDVASGIADALPEGEYPHLAELVEGLVLRPGYDYRAEFDFGLDLVLDGLARLVEADESPV